MVIDSSQLNSAPQQSDEELDSLTRDLPTQYELLGKVSVGGMGSIVKVRNRYTGALSAIKVLNADASRNREAVSRFVIEAKAASALKHPNICRVFDFGVTEQGTAYLVMDWINGIDLERKINREQLVPPKEAIFIFQQIAAGLAYAHRHKLVHRDVKPQNIMLSGEKSGRPEVHLVDFGIAKVMEEGEDATVRGQGVTRAGMVVGTPLFMSPEQATGAKVDNRSDIYSLGCVMYFALTGRPPFIGGSAVETVHKHLTELPPVFAPALRVPGDLQTIVFKALEKDPDDRYVNMDELLTDLKKLSKGVSIESRRHARQRHTLKTALKSVLYFTLSFLIVFAICTGLRYLTETPGSNTATKESHSQENNKRLEQPEKTQTQDK